MTETQVLNLYCTERLYDYMLHHDGFPKLPEDFDVQIVL